MKYLKYILLILILLLNTSCTKNNTSLKDDYYNYINKDIINKTKIKENEVGFSTFTKAQDIVDEKVSNLIDNSITNPKTNIELKISKLNSLIEDTTTRDKNKLSILTKYINLIDSSNNIKEFINNSITIEKDLNIDIFTQSAISKDYKDNTKNIIYFYPINFDYNTTSDYYTNSDYLYYHALLKQYNIKLLKEYGYSKEQAKKSAKLVDDFYKDIASNSKTSSDLQNIESYYNIIDKQALQQIYSNIDIDYYLDNMNISNINEFSIVDKDNYQKLNSYLTNDNLFTLKEYVKLKILQNYAVYASSNYSNLIYELNYKLQGLTQDNTSTKEKNEQIIKTYFSYDIDKFYTDNYFTGEEKKYVSNMTKDILNYYKEELKNNTWLSPKTLSYAIKKLQNIKINIGMSNDYPKYSELYNIDTKLSLIENIISIKKSISDYTLSKLKDNNNDTNVSQITVNAYYNAQDNSINFPAASSLLFDIKKSYYENLGTIGMVIAHEVTHAFDPNGAKFDAKGNLNNWWTKEDYQKFNKLKNKVISYYNKYEVIEGMHINGKLTANENIADLGSISCITKLAQNKNASNKDMQNLFKSFARLWASKYTEDYQKILLLQDNHSPNKYRVNATLSSSDIFYDVYHINKFNKMYISKYDRVKVW